MNCVLTDCMFIGAYYVDTARMTYVKIITFYAGLIGPLQSA